MNLGGGFMKLKHKFLFQIKLYKFILEFKTVHTYRLNGQYKVYLKFFILKNAFEMEVLGLLWFSHLLSVKGGGFVKFISVLIFITWAILQYIVRNFFGNMFTNIYTKYFMDG